MNEVPITGDVRDAHGKRVTMTRIVETWKRWHFEDRRFTKGEWIDCAFDCVSHRHGIPIDSTNVEPLEIAAKRQGIAWPISITI